MDLDFFKAFIDFLAVSAGQIPVKITNYGHVIRSLKSLGFVGGPISQIITDACGRIRVEQIMVSALLGCGHLITNISQIKGQCTICGDLCCTMPGCIEVCQFSGIPVCRKHYSVESGIVVATNQQGLFWKYKARALRKKLDEFSIERKLLETHVKN